MSTTTTPETDATCNEAGEPTIDTLRKCRRFELQIAHMRIEMENKILRNRDVLKELKETFKRQVARRLFFYDNFLDFTEGRRTICRGKLSEGFLADIGVTPDLVNMEASDAEVKMLKTIGPDTVETAFVWFKLDGKFHNVCVSGGKTYVDGVEQPLIGYNRWDRKLSAAELSKLGSITAPSGHDGFANFTNPLLFSIKNDTQDPA